MCCPIEDEFGILRRDFNSDFMVRIIPGTNKYESARIYLEKFTGVREKDTNSISIQEPYEPLKKRED